MKADYYNMFLSERHCFRYWQPLFYFSEFVGLNIESFSFGRLYMATLGHCMILKFLSTLLPTLLLLARSGGTFGI